MISGHSSYIIFEMNVAEASVYIVSPIRAPQPPTRIKIKVKKTKKFKLPMLEGVVITSTPNTADRRNVKKPPNSLPLPIPSPPPARSTFTACSVSTLRQHVAGGEVLLRVLAQPHGHLGDFLAQAVRRLDVHVGLSNQLGHVA
jgi:hypothetical protein